METLTRVGNMVVVGALALLLAVGLWASPHTAGAQYILQEPQLEVRPTLTPEDASEIAHIESLSTAATALYVTSIIVHVAGAGMAVGGAIGSICISFSGSCGDRSGAAAVAGIGLGAFGLGLVGLFVAIGLDGASGRARNRFRDTHPGFDFSLAPTEGGAAMTVLGRF